MQIIQIQPQPLRSVKPHAPAKAWLRGLSLAGLVTQDGKQNGPARDMQNLFSLCWALSDIEERIDQNRFRSKKTYLAPVGSLVVLLVVYLTTFQVASQQEDYGDRLWFFGAPWMFLAVLSVIGIVVIRVTNRRLMAVQANEYENAQTMREKTVAALIDARNQLFQTPFVLVADGRILAHVPHAQWLRNVLIEVPSKQRELRFAIEQALTHLEQTIHALATESPGASSAELIIDLADLHQQCVEADISRLPPLPAVISD